MIRKRKIEKEKRKKTAASHSSSMCRAIRNHVAWHVAFKRHINFVQQKIYVREIPNKTGFANLWQQQQQKNQSMNKLFWTSKKHSRIHTHTHFLSLSHTFEWFICLLRVSIPNKYVEFLIPNTFFIQLNSDKKKATPIACREEERWKLCCRVEDF